MNTRELQDLESAAYRVKSDGKWSLKDFEQLFIHEKLKEAICTVLNLAPKAVEEIKRAVAPEQEALLEQRDRFAFAIYDMLIHKTPKEGPRWDKLYDECLELCNAATERAALAAADRGGSK